MICTHSKLNEFTIKVFVRQAVDIYFAFILNLSEQNETNHLPKMQRITAAKQRAEPKKQITLSAYVNFPVSLSWSKNLIVFWCSQIICYRLQLVTCCFIKASEECSNDSWLKCCRLIKMTLVKPDWSQCFIWVTMECDLCSVLYRPFFRLYTGSLAQSLMSLCLVLSRWFSLTLVEQ